MLLPTFKTFLALYLLLLIIISPSFAFDDDSKGDTRSSNFNTFCENNQILNDTTSLKSSCKGEIDP